MGSEVRRGSRGRRGEVGWGREGEVARGSGRG